MIVTSSGMNRLHAAIIPNDVEVILDDPGHDGSICGETITHGGRVKHGPVDPHHLQVTNRLRAMILEDFDVMVDDPDHDVLLYPDNQIEQSSRPPAAGRSKLQIKKHGFYVQPYATKQVNNDHYKKDNGEWQLKPKGMKPLKKQVAQGGGKWVAGAAGDALGKLCIHRSVVREVSTGGSEHEALAETCVAEAGGLKFVSAGAAARALNASASAIATPMGASAEASASVAKASASAALVEGLIEAKAEASALQASASAGFGLKQLGVKAGAEAHVAKVFAGLSNTPLQASASGLGAEAEAGASWKYTGASVGAHLGEARAGPFAVRAGLKFGAGVRHGIPEVDLGFITIPCSIM